MHHVERRVGQPRYSDLAIETALTLGLVFGLCLRRTEGLLGSVLQLMGLDLAVPDHTTLSRRARTWQSPNRRPDLPIPSDGPVHVVVDSTGLKVYGAGQRLQEKHGARSRRGWRKLHLAVDADSGEIIAHTQVAPLLGQIDAPIEQFTADGAYDGAPTYEAIINHLPFAPCQVSACSRGVIQYQFTLQDADIQELGDWARKITNRLQDISALRDVGSDRQAEAPNLSTIIGPVGPKLRFWPTKRMESERRNQIESNCAS